MAITICKRYFNNVNSYSEMDSSSTQTTSDSCRPASGADHPRPFVPAAYASTAWSIAVIGSCFLTGVGYVLAQWYLRGAIEDAVFVSMLIAATMILMIGLRKLQRYVATKGLDFYSFVLATTDPGKAFTEHERLCSSVINMRRMTVSGILYGLTIGSAPFVLGVWPTQLVLQSGLACFMFFLNFATGIAFYSLLSFFYHAIRMGRMIKIDLWQVDNPSTNFLLGATRLLSIMASLYICICISSILFSVLPVGGLVIAYSCFSAATILASLIVPSFPVAQRLRDAKTKTFRDIDAQLHGAFYAALEQMKGEATKLDLTKFESLLQLREKVEAVQTWPFKIKSVTAGLSVIFFSSVPVVLQQILETISK